MTIFRKLSPTLVFLLVGISVAQAARWNELAALFERTGAIESRNTRARRSVQSRGGGRPAGERNVIVNGVPLAAEQVMALERAYRTHIQSGRYWYDPVSGVWGFEGGPAVGQIPPGLRLGGPLRADASRGHTGVFVNNRELHPLDVRALQQCTPVFPGRYWVNAQGIGGYQGGPPIFNLAVLCRRTGRGSGNSWVNADGSSSYRNDKIGLGVIIDSEGPMILGK